MFGFSPITVGMIVTIMLLALGLTVQTKRLESAKQEHAEFVSKVRALGEEQERKSKEKDAANAKQIKDAVADRNAALAKLRQSSPRRGELSRAGSAAPGSREICHPTPAYNAALAEYRERLGRQLEEIERLAIVCGESEIDAQTLLKAWPK